MANFIDRWAMKLRKKRYEIGTTVRDSAGTVKAAPQEDTDISKYYKAHNKKKRR